MTDSLTFIQISAMRRASLLALLLAASMVGPAPADEIEFNRDIRPILSEKCLVCHGFDEKHRQADLRLDVPESAYRNLDGVTPIKPGSPDESEVWLRITSEDEASMMPPPDSNHELTEAEKLAIKKWIVQGAPYERHWSFTAPEKRELPAIAGVGDDRAIDAFVRARLEGEGLQPAPEADRYTLIRRLSLDLTGLPPSAEEVEAFVHDENPHAYDRLVDRLLKSPHFGEAMALPWLDAARYADTNGFSIDGGREVWLWRDWVIQAFNDNKPYDRFLVEQIAGDLLPDATDADLIATGFQRNAMVTHEGGTIPEENLTNYNADRVKTLGEAVLGLTVGCAQCHDHKYDPITQKDYYELFAYFNTLGDRGLDGNSGVNAQPSIEARTVLRTGEEPALREQITELKEKLERPNGELLQKWVSRQRAMLELRGDQLALHPLNVLKVSTPNRGAGFDVEEERLVRLRQPGALGAFDIVTELPKLAEPITGLRVIMHPLPEYGGGWGSGGLKTSKNAKDAQEKEGSSEEEKGTFVLTAVAATADAVPGDQVNIYKLLEIARVTANSWDINHPPADCLDPRNHSGWSPDLQTEGAVHATVTFAEPVDSEATPFLTVQLNFGFGNNMIPGLVELQAVTGTDDGTDLPADVIAALETPEDARTEAMQQRLWEYCSAHAEELGVTRTALANLEERLAVLTKPFATMVMNVAEKPRETFILARGDYSQPTEKVTAGTLDVLPPMPDDAPSNRLGLAYWLVQPDHPLTSRVAVNRFWQQFFGTGLVATAADFGSQGEWPSHPELLDWLAVDFVESGWDVKRLVRRIVTSATYKQNSAATPEQLERDPANRLLARGPRFRLSAELVRDAALKASGLLVPRLGGPSVNPYMPADLWREVSHYGSTPATAQTFVQDHGEKLYRRSLYTFWKRTAPPPNMTAFDAPNREVCTVARPTTTTPLQALVLLNDTQFVEASRALADRILAQQGDDAARLRWAFLETLSRPATDRELTVLQQAVKRERRRYEADPDAALAYLSVGESPRHEAVDPAEQAAWAQVAALLMNLSEFVTRN